MATAQRSLGKLNHFLEVFNTGDVSQYRAFAAEQNLQGREPAPFWQLVHHDAGRLELVRIEEVSETGVTALVRTAIGPGWMLLRLQLEKEEPHRITGVMPGFSHRPFDLGPGRPASDQEIAAELTEYVDRLAAQDRFSGQVLVMRDGKVLFRAARGMACRAYQVPVGPATRFNLASMNKMFTGVAVAQLAQRGLLSFDDTLEKHLPDYPQEVASKVTIHHLLTHTAGLGSYWNEKWEKAKFRVRDVADYLALFQEEPLRFEPGQGWFYSNAGYILLGAVIEKVTGQSYFEYVREHIYRPAEMNDTDCYALDEDPPNLAVGYSHFDSKGAVHPDRWFNNTLKHVAKGGPAGGGYATGADMLRFAEALMGGELLDQAHTELVLTGKVKTELGPTEWYGYGFVESRLAAGRILGHSGGFSGINTYLDIYPDHGAVAVVLANYDFPAGKRVRDRILELIMQGR